MKNKVGAQKGAFIKMKKENIYTYQWFYRLCYVPIINQNVKENTPLKPLWDSFSLMSAKALKLNALIAEPGHQNCHHRSEIAPHGLTSTSIIHGS
ncbi:hypothetical protein ACKERV_005758 [Klebsiella pneumoniae]|uniref:hypothetical protein n=1 Tax=Klebsiella pneumoniae TaxID=573 RepID=UPI00298969E4|nr:hypothetical protein [Klebsiella pneumoniae]MCP6189207.1 hypothetical protein [Klebsiella pneumoniae]MDW5518441.1 hypothetical protein [Klebsiella pneumoniae subsp. pneumoniae]HBR5656821.1 hypothetical protein [Klebsiella pneumoniae]HBR5657377.1 hypothetical protein [Klebsiella pneumoniae]HBV6327114.1 hypothetical protein [Klebsiella pneumoniae]